METLALPLRDQFTHSYEKPSRWISAPLRSGKAFELHKNGAVGSSFNEKRVIANEVFHMDLSCGNGILPPATNYRRPSPEHMVLVEGSNVPFHSTNHIQFSPTEGFRRSNHGLLALPPTSWISCHPFPPVYSSFNPFHPYPHVPPVIPHHSRGGSPDSTFASSWQHNVPKNTTAVTSCNNKQGVSKIWKDAKRRIGRSDSVPQNNAFSGKQRPKPANKTNREIERRSPKLSSSPKDSKKSQNSVSSGTDRHSGRSSRDSLDKKKIINNFSKQDSGYKTDEHTDSNDMKPNGSFELSNATTPEEQYIPHFDAASSFEKMENQLKDIKLMDHPNGMDFQLENEKEDLSASNSSIRQSDVSKIHNEASQKKPSAHSEQPDPDNCLSGRSFSVKSMESNGISNKDESSRHDYANFAPAENWAGPAFTNSPPPSSLPLPRFPMRQLRSVSLELPPRRDEFDGSPAVAGSMSAPSSPPRYPSDNASNGAKLQGVSEDTVSATKSLRRILKLDFNS
eukprot:TRINITY_DN565_c0_g2_i1.p1 TRINITY_DN565_c0_g2~~TRINITY_DN565_c0_g2_i1.p1  ORF type:complete len:509 (+),score=86.45 TRINITY_DN565_c0_g2_i1:812-2338(+)